jgi:threonine dehydrogenase-like Zn-dependent dehydrogenase
VLIGVIGLNISRADFYTKEISFQVSCSYGPGRYDDNYEKNGQDYPIGFVRWTEKRNFDTVLQLISNAGIDVKSLITEVIKFENFEKYMEIWALAIPSHLYLNMIKPKNILKEL